MICVTWSSGHPAPAELTTEELPQDRTFPTVEFRDGADRCDLEMSSGVNFGKLVSVRGGDLLDGRYRLVDRIGSGGMSVVWRARDHVLDRAVAVKVLAGPDASDPGARARIRAEAQAAARLWHPHVTNVYDYGESVDESGDRVPYVVMELLPGTTLAQRLADGALPPRTAMRVCAEVADALAAAHAQDLVHRDVKPSNVMLTPSGAKVVDFGIAAVVGRQQVEEDGQLFGTPAYLAPERLTGNEVLPASDVYALGLLIHRALTNELPWQAETTTQMLASHAYVEPAPLPALDGVPALVNDVCNRCLAKDPALRPSAAEVARVLRKAAGIVPPDDGYAPPSEAGPVGNHARRRRRRLALAGAVVAVAIAAVPVMRADFGGPRRSGVGAEAPGAAAPGASPSPSGAAGPTAPRARATPTGSPPAGGGGAQPIPSRGAASLTPERPVAPPGNPPPAPGPAPAPPPLPGIPIISLGGTVRVACSGSTTSVLGVDLNVGYAVKDYDPGPADEVQVVLLSAVNESEIKVTCRRGEPKHKIKESPQ